MNLARVLKLVEKIFRLNLKGQLILNFSGKKDIKIESKFGEETTYKLFED